MNYREIIDRFGIEDQSPSELLLKLTVDWPDFSWRDLISILTEVYDHFHAKDDVRGRDSLSASAQVGKTMQSLMASLQSLQSDLSSGTYYQSDIIIRNLFRVLFETNTWDQDIIQNADFFEAYSKLCTQIDEDTHEYLKMKRLGLSHQYGIAFRLKGNDPLNARETYLELKDKLIEKIKLLSGA